MDRFVSDYLGLLDVRMSTLRDLLVKPDAAEEVRVSILSLETTSAMLGATEVVMAARALRAAAMQQDGGSEERYDQLLQAVEEFRQSLVSQGFAN